MSEQHDVKEFLRTSELPAWTHETTPTIGTKLDELLLSKFGPDYIFKLRCGAEARMCDVLKDPDLLKKVVNHVLDNTNLKRSGLAPA